MGASPDWQEGGYNVRNGRCECESRSSGRKSHRNSAKKNGSRPKVKRQDPTYTTSSASGREEQQSFTVRRSTRQAAKAKAERFGSFVSEKPIVKTPYTRSPSPKPEVSLKLEDLEYIKAHSAQLHGNFSTQNTNFDMGSAAIGLADVMGIIKEELPTDHGDPTLRQDMEAMDRCIQAMQEAVPKLMSLDNDPLNGAVNRRDVITFTAEHNEIGGLKSVELGAGVMEHRTTGMQASAPVSLVDLAPARECDFYGHMNTQGIEDEQGKTNSKSPKSHQQPFEATADMLAPLDMGLPNSEWDWMDHTGLSCSGGSENSMHAFKSGALHRHVSKFCPTENNLYSPPTPEKGGGLCTTPFHLHKEPEPVQQGPVQIMMTEDDICPSGNLPEDFDEPVMIEPLDIALSGDWTMDLNAPLESTEVPLKTGSGSSTQFADYQAQESANNNDVFNEAKVELEAVNREIQPRISVHPKEVTRFFSADHVIGTDDHLDPLFMEEHGFDAQLFSSNDVTESE